MNGCDSIVALTLYTFSSSFTSLTQNTCAGDTFYFGNSALTDAGFYTDTLQNAQGCDSVIELALIVLPVYTFSIDTAIVQGSTFTLPSGTVVSAAGIYNDTLMTGEGCDSVIVTNLSVVTSNQFSNSIVSEKPLRIYPNPANNELFIEANGLPLEQINIYDAIGSLVSESDMLLNKRIDISNFAKGIYIAEITTPKTDSSINTIKIRWVKM